MIVTIHQHDAAKGGQFYETARYILSPQSHETKQAIRDGQLDPATIGSRVGHVAAVNLDDTGRTAAAIAARMSKTAASSNELKRAAWEADPKNAGKPFRSGRPPKGFDGEHITLSWHTSENPTWQEMQDAARSLLKERGIDPERHEILIAEHLDTKHKHLHLLVNRVSFKDGYRFSPPKRDWWTVEAWADRYERERGQNFIPERRAKVEARAAAVKSKKRGKAHDREPKQEQASPAPKQQPKPRPPKQSYALKNAEQTARRAGVKLDSQAREELAALEKPHADEWARLNEQGKQHRADAQATAKSERAASFAQSKAEQKAARAQARREYYSGIVGGMKKLADDYAQQRDWQQYKDRKTARWRLYFRREKTAGGVILNALWIADEARKRGLNAPSRLDLIKDPEARKEMMRRIDYAERNRIYERAARRKPPEIERRAQQIVKQARADHAARVKEINARARALPNDLKAARSELGRRQKEQVYGIIEAAHQRSISRVQDDFDPARYESAADQYDRADQQQPTPADRQAMRDKFRDLFNRAADPEKAGPGQQIKRDQNRRPGRDR